MLVKSRIVTEERETVNVGPDGARTVGEQVDKMIIDMHEAAGPNGRPFSIDIEFTEEDILNMFGPHRPKSSKTKSKF